MNSFTSHVLTLSGAQLSDLFFNHEHTNLDILYQRHSNKKDPPSSEVVNQAALLDAMEFVAAYSVPVTPQELAEDFQSRV